MNNLVKIEVLGKILEGEYENWFILVEDDQENIGGFLIFLFNHPDKLKRTIAYDYWAEDKSSLERMFQEAGWKIEWLN